MLCASCRPTEPHLQHAGDAAAAAGAGPGVLAEGRAINLLDGGADLDQGKEKACSRRGRWAGGATWQLGSPEHRSGQMCMRRRTVLSKVFHPVHWRGTGRRRSLSIPLAGLPVANRWGASANAPQRPCPAGQRDVQQAAVGRRWQVHWGGLIRRARLQRQAGLGTMNAVGVQATRRTLSWTPRIMRSNLPRMLQAAGRRVPHQKGQAAQRAGICSADSVQGAADCPTCHVFSQSVCNIPHARQRVGDCQLPASGPHTSPGHRCRVAAGLRAPHPCPHSWAPPA